MTHKLAFVILIALLCPIVLMAQDTTAVKGWKKSLIFDFTTAQSSYSNSWVGGEAGSLNWVSNLNGTAERQLKSWLNYRTIFKASFGQTLTQDVTTHDWSKPKKSTDLIDWDNLMRFTTNRLVDPYAALRLETQFYSQFDNSVTAYFRPLKLTESGGVARKFYSKDKDIVLSRLGLALRQIVKPYLTAADSLIKKDSALTDGGVESVTDFSLTLNKRVLYVGKLSLYKALFFSGSDKVKGTAFENDWKAIDINWENQFRVQVTKIITVNLYTQLLYDKEVSRKGRLKETLALGLIFHLA
ncbi:MAG: DUF3078 domain-containing protein [Candidatus Zixiibacteriota bacterium]|nr:MAG: DUF3078 domain-containing protein [candidate division Zixibacteria bacterium]